MVQISIVIPAYNEEKRLPKTLERVLTYFAGGDPMNLGSDPSNIEVLVVDDGSTDGTLAVAESFALTHRNVRVLRNPGNRGKGFSVRHGMLEAKGNCVLFSDADLSAPIEEWEKLARAIDREKAQVAIGSRGIDRSLIGVHQSWLRENAGKLFNLLMRLIVGLPFWDTQCGFKVFIREAARDVFQRQTIDGFGFDVESLFIARKLGYKIVEVPVRWDHAEGTKVSMTGDSLRMFADLLTVRWNSLRGMYRK